MSRSLHPTLKRYGVVTTPKLKRSLKKAVRQGRRARSCAARLATVPTDAARDAARVSIVDRNSSPNVHFPASVADMRAVLARLPDGTLDGLAGIELCAPGGELTWFTPDVLAGEALGCYNFGDRSSIFLFGYVYDRDRADRRALETYLRLEMLATLVHEVAHHADISPPTARGRWDRFLDRESLAEAAEHAWTQDIVIPYLEEAHADDVAHLLAFLREHGAVDLDLTTLLDDPRLRRSPRSFGIFSRASLVFDVIDDVRRGTSAVAVRRSVAQKLRHQRRYDEAERVLTRAIRGAPGDRGARLLLARVYIEQARFDEAIALTRELVAEQPADPDVWCELGDLAERRGDWLGAREARARRRSLLPATHERSHRLNDVLLARALVETGEWTAAAEELAALEARAVTKDHRCAVLQARARLMFLRGDDEAALALVRASEEISELFHPAPLSAAVRFAAARRLGRPEDAGHLTLADVEWLRTCGYGAWVTELGLCTEG